MKRRNKRWRQNYEIEKVYPLDVSGRSIIISESMDTDVNFNEIRILAQKCVDDYNALLDELAENDTYLSDVSQVIYGNLLVTFRRLVVMKLFGRLRRKHNSRNTQERNSCSGIVSASPLERCNVKRRIDVKISENRALNMAAMYHH